MGIPKKPIIAAAHDILMAAVSFALSLYLRLGDTVDYSAPFFVPALIVFTTVCVTVFLSTGLYRGIWRYASMHDLLALARAVTLAILIFLPLMFMINRLEGMPRSVVFINWFVLLALLGGPRFLYRMIKDRTLHIDLHSRPESQKIAVLLVGINSFTEAFLRHTVQNRDGEYRVVGLLSVKDNAQSGRKMHDIPILGALPDLETVCARLKSKGNPPQKLIVSPGSIEGGSLRDLLQQADTLGLTVARLPRVTELYNNIEESVPLRPIALEDLLGRPQTPLDRESMKKLVENRIVLVTGAGGTIGGELSRQIADKKPDTLILVDISEHNLYLIDHELSEKHPDLKKHPLIGDVRDEENIRRIFKQHKPEIVFHAAALKHVPLSEINSCEAVATNTLGTRNVADACITSKIDLMVLISTDKAVSPASVMGASKRAAELYIQALDQSRKGKHTKFATVRFGNVLGSNGSVVPLFQRQLAAGGPLTITHPDMKRYFMTVREAVELVLQAAALRYETGDAESSIYVLDMGEPVFIKDLARQMIRLTGLQPNKDIKIEYTGLRPGEKLEEHLFLPSESPSPTKCEGLLLVQPSAERFSRISRAIKSLASAVQTADRKKTIFILREIVAEFTPSP